VRTLRGDLRASAAYAHTPVYAYGHSLAEETYERVQPIHIHPCMPTGRVDLRARAEASICIAICFTGLYACGSGCMQFRLVRIGLLSNSSPALNISSECLRTPKLYFETQRNCKHFDSLPESVHSYDNKPARHDDKPVHEMCFTGLYACSSGRMPMML
jgi:hypothetical protein